MIIDARAARRSRNVAKSPAAATVDQQSTVLQRALGVDQRVDTDEAVLVEVIVGHEVGRRMINRRVEIMECHLSGRSNWNPSGCGNPGQWVRVSTVASFGEPSITTFGLRTVAPRTVLRITHGRRVQRVEVKARTCQVVSLVLSRQVTPGSGVCGPLWKTSTNCCSLGSLTDCNNNCLPHAVATIGDGRPSYSETRM